MGLALDELKEEDEKVSANGVELIYNKTEKDYISHSIIDFEDSFLGKGFVVRSMHPSAC